MKTKNPKNKVSYKEMMHHEEDALLKFMGNKKNEKTTRKDEDTSESTD